MLGHLLQAAVFPLVYLSRTRRQIRAKPSWLPWKGTQGRIELLFIFARIERKWEARFWTTRLDLIGPWR